MSKRDKYQHAIHVLESHLVNQFSPSDCSTISNRRRKQLCAAIMALGGDNPDDPGDSGGGPGEEGPGGP